MAIKLLDELKEIKLRLEDIQSDEGTIRNCELKLMTIESGLDQFTGERVIYDNVNDIIDSLKTKLKSIRGSIRSRSPPRSKSHSRKKSSLNLPTQEFHRYDSGQSQENTTYPTQPADNTRPGFQYNIDYDQYKNGNNDGTGANNNAIGRKEGVRVGSPDMSDKKHKRPAYMQYRVVYDESEDSGSSDEEDSF